MDKSLFLVAILIFWIAFLYAIPSLISLRDKEKTDTDIPKQLRIKSTFHNGIRQHKNN